MITVLTRLLRTIMVSTILLRRQRKDVAHTDGLSKGIAILEEELRQAKASLALEKAKCRDAIALNDRNVALKSKLWGEIEKCVF